MSPLFIRQALISVSDKSNLLPFAKQLFCANIQLLSTNGTANTLSKSGITVHKISKYTQFPEIMNGRIKTLHHKIYAGILNRSKSDDDIMYKYNIKPIDMIVVNFYPFPFNNTQDNPYDLDQILEYIDIGGPSMVRAAAKNYKNTVVITDKNDYDTITHELHKHNGYISLQTRLMLATKAFKYIAEYDSVISNYFNDTLNQQSNQNYTDNNIKQIIHLPSKPKNPKFPKIINCDNSKFIKKQDIRYGENPHQTATLYQEQSIKPETGFIANAKQLQGKLLSYNNIVDMDTALECVKMFDQIACVIVKHANPCGVAISDNIYTAYKKAYLADPISAFGGVIAFNKPLNDKKTAQSIINQNFVEAIIAPNINQDCLDILSLKKDIRILKSGMWTKNDLLITKDTLNIDFKRISGGLLVQDYDYYQPINLNNLQIVTDRKPSKQEVEDALFCWKIVKFVKSNAIVCGKNYQTTGIGIGQTNRVFSVKLATSLRLNKSIEISGSSLASDAFFTFPDGIQEAANTGISCIIQPGGSIRDPQIIQTANKFNLSMIFTHTRHFRH